MCARRIHCIKLCLQCYVRKFRQFIFLTFLDNVIVRAYFCFDKTSNNKIAYTYLQRNFQNDPFGKALQSYLLHMITLHPLWNYPLLYKLIIKYLPTFLPFTGSKRFARN